MTLLLGVNLAAGVALLAHAVCTINHMSARTNHVVRIGYILLAVGATGIVLGPLYGHAEPQASEVITNAAAVLVLISRHKQWKGWIS